MIWLSPGSCDYVLSALQADILRELSTAGEYLRLACRLSAPAEAGLRHTLVTCVSEGFANASALAAEIIAIGGVPPCLVPRDPAAGLTQPPELKHLRSHYLRRVMMAKRLGLQRLEEIFRQIAASKAERGGDLRRVARAFQSLREHNE